MNDTFKGLPVMEIALIAVCVIVEVRDPEDGGVQTEMDVFNQPLWDNFKPQNQPNRCGCCGHTLKYACAVVHTPTGNGYWVGRDCAAKVERLKAFDKLVANSSVALAERIACNAREAQFLAAHPDFMGIIAWCKLPSAPRIARDMIEKMRRFGNLSEKQIQALENIKTKDEERRAKATGKALNGRHTVRGKVVSWKKVPGFAEGDEVTKITVDFGNGVRAFGNAPTWNQHDRYLQVRKGDEVEFTATFEPSKNDDLFGFWKRPAKFKILKHVAEDLAKWESIFTANPGLREMPAGDARYTALQDAARKADMNYDDLERFISENVKPQTQTL